MWHLDSNAVIAFLNGPRCTFHAEVSDARERNESSGPGPAAGPSCPGVAAPQPAPAFEQEPHTQTGGPLQGFAGTVSRGGMKGTSPVNYAGSSVSVGRHRL